MKAPCTRRTISWISVGRGHYGGELVAQGGVQDMRREESLTGQYLSGAKKIYVPDERRPGNSGGIIVKGAKNTILRISMWNFRWVSLSA